MSINNVSEYKKIVDNIKKKINIIDTDINILNDNKQELIHTMEHYNSLLYKCCVHNMIIDYIDERTHTLCLKCGFRT